MNLKQYALFCPTCSRTYSDTDHGFLLTCSEDHEPALLRAVYPDKQLTVHSEHPGLFRYSDWLPVRRVPETASGPVVYQSMGLGHYLKLDNLFIAFNGYWPEKEASEETCSFKELEAQSVCARIPEGEERTMVVTSAGNTGMAFLQICSQRSVPAVVIVPERILPELWTTVEKAPNVTLAVLRGEVDYADVIEVGNRLAMKEGYFPEGGALNVARRDGMGSVLLAAVERIGEIPAHYFQAVGSGTGGIAAWEMALRLREDGRFGRTRMRLHLVQNSPFTVMSDAWQQASRELLPLDEIEGRERVAGLHAHVLSNRRPPYSIAGGVFDALTDTRGSMYSVGKREAVEAGELFRKLEGIDIHPAAEVALAGLIEAVMAGKIRKREIVVLNVTGGGSLRLEGEGRKRALEPDVVISADDDTNETLAATIEKLEEDIEKSKLQHTTGSTSSSSLGGHQLTDLFDKCRGDAGYFGRFRAVGDKYFTQPVLDGLPGPRMRFQGKNVIMWAVNNYLGLAGNEKIKAAARAAVEKWGTFTPMGSRMLTGNTEAHQELERRLAAYLSKPAAVVFNYGYLGVVGTITALVGKNDEIIMDKLSHASIVDGVVLASAGRRFRPFKHNDMDDLERHLKAANRDRKGGILIVTEGVYGMRGDIANLPEICELKDRYGARLLIDDAHGFGVVGDTGRGSGEYYGVQDRIDLYFGTFAKAFAAIGGVTAGETEPVEYVRYNARTNVFAKSLPMAYVETLSATLDVMLERPDLRERMWKISRMLQEGLVDLGYDIGDTKTPITPVYVPAGNEDTAMEMITMLREDYGVFVSGVTFPVVPRGIVLFRMIPTAAHSEEDVEKTINAFRGLRDRMNVDLSKSPSIALKAQQVAPKV